MTYAEDVVEVKKFVSLFKAAAGMQRVLEDAAGTEMAVTKATMELATLMDKIAEADAKLSNTEAALIVSDAQARAMVLEAEKKASSIIADTMSELEVEKAKSKDALSAEKDKLKDVEKKSALAADKAQKNLSGLQDEIESAAKKLADIKAAIAKFTSGV